MELEANPPDTARRTLVAEREGGEVSIRQLMISIFMVIGPPTHLFSRKDDTVFTQHGTKLVYEIFLETTPKEINRAHKPGIPDTNILHTI